MIKCIPSPNTANVEILSHDIGVSESYWRPTEHELLEDYLKAIPLLSILENSVVLEKRIEQLTEESNVYPLIPSAFPRLLKPSFFCLLSLKRIRKESISVV